MKQFILFCMGMATQGLFALALVFALMGDDASFKIAMGTGAYGLANQVIGYWFGSSASSDRKTDLLKGQLDVSNSAISH